MTTKIHRASLGEHAPANAVREGRVEIVLADATGRRQSYGRLVERRQIGGYLVQLTDDVRQGMWWIVAVRLDPARQMVIGFRQGRRVDAEHVFRHVTEEDLDHGADDPSS